MNQACEKGVSDVVNIQQARPAGKDVERSVLSDALIEAWLAWQCRMIAGLFRGVVIRVDDGQLADVISSWPDKATELQQFIEAATESLRQTKGIVRSQQPYGTERQRFCDMVASPLMLNGKPVAVIVVMMSARAELQQQAVLQLLQWGGLWVETLMKQDANAENPSSSFALQLVNSIVGHSELQAAAMDLVNQFADRYRCERVSLGFVKSMSVELQAMSHVTNIDSRTQIVRKIESAMTEAVDQAISIIPGQVDSENNTVSRANRELASQQGEAAVCSILLPGQQAIIGAITLERVAGQPFDAKTVMALEATAGLLGPIIETRLEAKRGLLSRIRLALKTGFQNLFGPARLKLKLGLAALVVGIAALALIPSTYKVTAPASIEGAVRQIMVAPVAGYVKQAEIRAGDIVKTGQLITRLDDRSLQLELQKWRSDRNKIEKEYQDALASRERSQLSILQAQIEQVDAEIKLVQEQIAQTELKSPFDGIVVSGDLSQKLGVPVEIGQALFEIAPLESYRIVLEVDEHDVAGLEAGKTGHLVMAALPRNRFEFSLEQLLPVAVSGQGNNYFRVEAALSEPSALLRPGMRGIAKVEIGQRSLLWNLTHTVVDRIRLWAWKVGL